MNPPKLSRKKLKALLIVGFFGLLFFVTILVIYRNMDNNNNLDGDNEFVGIDNTFGFNQSVNLNRVNPNEKYHAQMGTESYPTVVVSEDAEVSYRNGRIYVQVNEGYDIYSSFWVEESFATYVKEPTFGLLQKFVISPHSMTATYIDVTMKDLTSYINELSGLGFNDVVRNEEIAKDSVYIYSAKKDLITVTLNYENNQMVITVSE